MTDRVTASTTLVDYLASKGIHTHRAAGDEVTAACWWCNDGKTNKRKLYLNTETWQFYCQVCTEHGGRRALLTYFGDQEKDELKWAPGTDPAMRRKVLTEATALAQDMLLNNPKVLDYLTGERGLDPQTIVDAQIGYAPTSWGLGRMLLQTNDRADVVHSGLLTTEGQEFFSGHILIPYLSHGHVEQLRGKIYVPGKINGKYVTPSGDNARLYGSDDLLGAKKAIIVEGEFDRLALKQALRLSGDPVLQGIAVVGLSGAGSHPIGMEGMLESCTRIYTGLDPDDAGDISRDRLKTTFGAKVREIKLPREMPKCDWSDYLGPVTEKNKVHGGHGWKDVRELIDIAESEGRRLFTIRDAQRQLRHYEQTIGGVQIGFHGIDTYIEPGIKPGQVLIPIARTGAGKTAFMATVTWNVRLRPTLILSLELSAAEYYDRLRKIAWFYNPLATDEWIADQLSLVRIYDATLRAGEMTRLAEEYADEVGVDPQFVGLDYIGYASKHFSGSSQYERTTNAVMTIKEEAKAGKFALLAPHQAGRTAAGGVPVRAEDARDSGAIEDTADILMSLFRPGDADPRNFDSTVTAGILKNRNGRKDVQTNLVFGMATNILVQKGTPESALIDDENRLIISGHKPHEVREYRRRNALAKGLHQPTLTAAP